MDRPVARSDAEPRVRGGHGETVPVLDEAAAPAAFSVIGHAGERFEIGRIRPPVEPVRQQPSRRYTNGGSSGERHEAGPQSRFVPQTAEPESLDEEECAAESGAKPPGARPGEE